MDMNSTRLKSLTLKLTVLALFIGNLIVAQIVQEPNPADPRRPNVSTLRDSTFDSGGPEVQLRFLGGSGVFFSDDHLNGRPYSVNDANQVVSFGFIDYNFYGDSLSCELSGTNAIETKDTLVIYEVSKEIFNPNNTLDSNNSYLDPAKLFDFITSQTIIGARNSNGANDTVRGDLVNGTVASAPNPGAGPNAVDGVRLLGYMAGSQLYGVRRGFDDLGFDGNYRIRSATRVSSRPDHYMLFCLLENGNDAGGAGWNIRVFPSQGAAQGLNTSLLFGESDGDQPKEEFIGGKRRLTYCPNDELNKQDYEFVFNVDASNTNGLYDNNIPIDRLIVDWDGSAGPLQPVVFRDPNGSSLGFNGAPPVQQFESLARYFNNSDSYPVVQDVADTLQRDFNNGFTTGTYSWEVNSVLNNGVNDIGSLERTSGQSVQVRVKFRYPEPGTYRMTYTFVDANNANNTYTEEVEIVVLDPKNIGYNYSSTFGDPDYEICEGTELKVDVEARPNGTLSGPGGFSVNMVPEDANWISTCDGCFQGDFTISPNGNRLTFLGSNLPNAASDPYKNVVQATVENNPQCLFQDTIDIVVNPRVDAGAQVAEAVKTREYCSDDDTDLDLITFLIQDNGDPADGGGNWRIGSTTLPGGDAATISPKEIFDINGAGSSILNYSIDGKACPDDQANIEIIIFRKPHSGVNNKEVEEICEDGSINQEIDLFELLTRDDFESPKRSPDPNGTWTFEGNVIEEPIIRDGRFLMIKNFIESQNLTRPFTLGADLVYTAPDAVGKPGLCEVESATAQVLINSRPVIGEDTLIYVCTSDGFLDLDNDIGRNTVNGNDVWNSGGTWIPSSQVTAEGLFLDPQFFDASKVQQDRVYRMAYSLAGAIPDACEPFMDSLIVMLDVQVEKYMGQNKPNFEICSTAGDTALYDLLQAGDSKTIDETGLWYEELGNGDLLYRGIGKNFRVDFGALTADTDLKYFYTTSGSPDNFGDFAIFGCDSTATLLDISVTYSPEPGFFNDTIVTCVNAPQFVPFDSLMGGAETGGTWTGNTEVMSVPFNSNSFVIPDRLVADGKIYKIVYGFNVGGPCAANETAVHIRALPGPDAGDDVVIPDPLCSSEGTFDLSQVLNDNNSFAFGTLTPTSPELLHEFIATDPNAVLDPQTGILDLTNLGDIDGEEYEFEFRVFSNTCAADVAKITMTIYRQPNAGDDQSVVICNTAPVFNVFDEVLNENGGVDDYGRWEVEPVIEQAVAVNGLGTTFDPEQVGATTTDFTEGDYIYYIVEAIDDVCPDDTAIISTFTSIQPKIGIPTSSPNEPLPICQSETGFDLFEGVTGEYDRGGRWSLKSYPAFRVGEPKFEKFKEQVNDTSLNDPYLSGEFLETLDAYHFDTVYNSVDGFDIFDAPIFKFSYVLEDTTVNYFPATPDHNFMYECQKDSIDTYVRFVRYYTNEDMTDYLWDESDNYLFRPYEAGQFPVLTIDNQDNAEVVICDSDRDFVLNDYFIGLDDILSVLDLDYDTFYFEGINEVGGIYPTTIFQQDYFVDATKMDIDNNPYNVTINVENECGVFTSEIPLQINLEEEFDVMPIDDIILCGNADPVDPKDPLYIGDYYKDLLDKYPQETGIRALGNSGEVYVAEEIDPTLADPTPAFYKLELFGDRVTCNDLSVEIDVVIERTPFTGNDKESVAVCEGDVVSLASFVNEDVSDNGDFVDPSGVWTGPNSYGPFPYSSATFDTEGRAGELIEFVYTVDKDGCNPVSTTIELLIIERPHAGSDNTAEVCSNETNLFLLDLLQDADGLPDPSGRFINAPYPGQSGNFQDVTRLSAGTYTYTYVVQGNRPCPDDQAVLTLIVKEPQSSGSDGELDICLGNSVANLFNGLNGTPSDQGYFVPANPGVVDEFYLSGSNKQFFDFNSYFADKGTNFKDTVEFKYVIDGGTCPSDTAYVQVNILPQPTSGTAANIPAVVCNENVTQDLKVFLGSPIVNGSGDYLEGGTWRALTPNRAGLSPDGIINPSLLEPENIHRFEYRVTTKCGSASSVVVLRVDEIPEMPEDVVDSVCADFQKLDLAVAYPQYVGGTWVDVNSHGGLTGSVFDYLNAVDLPEYSFEYQKPSEFGECADGIGNLTLRYFDKPNAGEDSIVSTIVCKMNGNLVNVDMFDLLTGADAGGTFTSTNPVAQAAISGTVFRVTNNVPNDTYTIEYEVEAGNCPSDVAILRIRVEGQNGNSPTCGDVDNDGILNFEDLDDDNDGMSDITEGLGDDIFGDHDNDLTLNFRDAEWAAIVGSSISQGVVSIYDKDADGVIDAWDLDSDGDNIFDIAEAFPNDYTVFDVNKDGMTDDVNSEGINAVLQGFSPENTDGTDEPDYRDTDSDNDGIFDGLENNGQAWDVVKSDADDLADYRDTDSDDDSILDEIENLGAGFNAWIDTDGDGTPDAKDTDSDGDLIPDADEAYLSGITPEDFDTDGIPNFQDIDSDGDNISDYHEALRTGNAINTDKDILNNNPDENEDFRDIDSDGDGIKDRLESALTMPSFDVNDPTVGAPHDADKDGIADYRELDADADGFVDAFEAGPDLDNPYNSDNDPRPLYDFQQVDADGDGMLDEFEAGIEKVDGVFINIPVNTDLALDNNPDIFYDFQDTDSDGDMIPDAIEGFDVPRFDSLPGVDTDGDEIADYLDLDSDNDSISDEKEAGFNPLSPDDSDDDGIYDFRDTDADNDGVLDRIEGEGDCDGDGRPNYKDAGDDCRVEVFVPEGISPNGDGVNDVFRVPDLAVFPNNSIKVYNRWGGLVYEVNQYQQDWGGTDENGELLPDGTYFYVIDLGIGQEAQVGYVYITSNR